jgi:hypothetical protein
MSTLSHGSDEDNETATPLNNTGLVSKSWIVLKFECPSAPVYISMHSIGSPFLVDEQAQAVRHMCRRFHTAINRLRTRIESRR